jgi:pre-mRNA-splicing factor ATP-dependent RNA helicase DHX16
LHLSGTFLLSSAYPFHFPIQIIEDRSSKGDTEATRRRNLADDKQSRAAALPDIRDRSRQEYLKLREQQRLELLRQEIQDEAFLFGDQRLSKKEIEQHEYKKQVLALAEARLKIDSKEDGYVMPEGKMHFKKWNQCLYGMDPCVFER